jgi:hypothetical protein
MPSSFSHQHEASTTAAAGGVAIDDDTPSTTTAYSSQKIEDEIALLVPAAGAPELPETTDLHRIVLTTATERIYEDGLRIYRETNNAINIGDHEESNRSTRDESICIGLSSGCLGNATHQKTCVGYQSARGTSGDQIVCMGVRAFQGSTGSNITAVGHYAGSQLNNGTRATLLGNYAGQFSTDLTDSVAIGTDSCRNTTSTGITESTHVGNQSGNASITAGTTAIGFQAGISNTGDNCVMLGYQQGTNNTDNDRLMIGNSAAHAIIDGTMGIDHASCVLRLKADTIVLGNSLPIAFNASEPQAVWVSDSTLRRGNYVPSGGGIVETEGYFLKSTNNYVWYSDELIIMSWDGFDEVFVKHTGAAGIPADVYATSHLHTNSVISILKSDDSDDSRPRFSAAFIGVLFRFYD